MSPKVFLSLIVITIVNLSQANLVNFNVNTENVDFLKIFDKLINNMYKHVIFTTSILNGSLTELIIRNLIKKSVTLLTMDELLKTSHCLMDYDMLVVSSDDFVKLLAILKREKFRAGIKMLVVTLNCDFPTIDNAQNWKKLQFTLRTFSYTIVDANFTICWHSKASQSLRKSEIKIMAFHCPPFLSTTVDSIYKKDYDIYDGLEYRIFKELVRRNKWKLNYQLLRYDANVKSNYTRIVQKIIDGKADVGICSQWMSIMNPSLVDISYPYTDICMTFLVPKPKPLPKFTFALQPLQATVWYVYLIITFIFVPLMMKTVKDLSYFQCLFDILRLAALSSLPYRCTDMTDKQRFLMCFLFYIFLLMSTAYVTGFTSLLFIPRYTQSIETVDDMIEGGIKWGGPESINFSTLIDMQRPGVDELIRNFRVFDKADYNQLLRTMNYAIYAKKLRGYIEETEGLDEFALTHLKILNTCLLNSHVVFVLKKNSPYKKSIDHWLRHFVETGMINYWYSRTRWSQKMKYMDNFYTNYVQLDAEERERRKFTVENLQFVLCVVGFGYFLGLCSLIIEMLNVTSTRYN